MDGQLVPEPAPSWEELVREHSAMVFRVALRLTGNRHDAEDLTQDVFVKAFRSIHAFEPGTITGWLHRITTNLFLDQARRRSRLRFDPVAHTPEPGASVPQEEALADGLDFDIAEALADLPPNHRVAVVLCDIEGLPHDEIARILDVRAGTVRTWVHRGRERLRRSLAHRRPAAGNSRAQGAPDEVPA